jgi:hypothetical protein
MARGKLFEYAILYHPKPEKDAQGKEIQEKSKLLKEPTRVLAARTEDVGVLAAREIPDDYLDKIEDVEIVVRPF